MSYEVGSSVTVRALHQMPVQGPEGELHAHDYRIDVVVTVPARTKVEVETEVGAVDVVGPLAAARVTFMPVWTS